VSATETTAGDLREGVNDPSPIARVLILDYYDGPLGGVLRLGGGAVFRYALLDERQLDTNDSVDIRVYGLYPLAADALDRLTEVLTPHTTPPRWPVWCPHWQFANDETRRQVDGAAEDILKRAGRLSWVVVGDLTGGPFRAIPVQVARAS
jgi:hypothetical protein